MGRKGELTGVSTSRAPGKVSGLYSRFLSSSLVRVGRTVLRGERRSLGRGGYKILSRMTRVMVVMEAVRATMSGVLFRSGMKY